jgi:hypothetical protein
VTTVFIEASALLLEGGAPADASTSPLQTGADAALGDLAEAGHHVIVVGATGSLPTAIRDIAPSVGPIPADLPEWAWLLTGELAGCSERRPRLRTILVGPPGPQVGGPQVRCDVEARDLRAAVIEILAREAMPR